MSYCEVRQWGGIIYSVGSHIIVSLKTIWMIIFCSDILIKEYRVEGQLIYKDEHVLPEITPSVSKIYWRVTHS